MQVIRVIGIESDLAQAARLAVTTPPLPRKESIVNNSVNVEQPKRKRGEQNRMTHPEYSDCVDWMRVPGNLDGLTTYQAVADAIGEANIIGRAPSVASVQKAMQDKKIELWKPPAPPEQVRETDKVLARAIVAICRELGTAIPPGIAELADVVI